MVEGLGHTMDPFGGPFLCVNLISKPILQSEFERVYASQRSTLGL